MENIKERDETTEVKKNKSGWLSTFLYMAITALVTYILFGCILGIGIVAGHSMEPNFFEGDVWLISRVGYTLDYSDVVIIKNSGVHEYLIKRVIGLPGDEITYSIDGLVAYRNGELLAEDYIADTDESPSGIYETVVVDDDCVFVLGDNRLHSLDSRGLGQVPIDDVVGKHLFMLIRH